MSYKAGLVSIIVPSRNESNLYKTVEDIVTKATGDVEVLVMFDGPPYTPLPEYDNVSWFEMRQSGTKLLINLAADMADGEYLMKVDAHCMFGEGFDEILKADMQDNWVVTPRFYVLNAAEWKWQDGRFYDYFKLPCPFTDHKMFRFQAGGHWPERTQERLDIPIDENMKLHGSAWFMKRDFFLDCLGGLDMDSGAGTWSGEDIEISLKTWLGPWDGRLMVNKNTWYAHMHKSGNRGWHVSRQEINDSYAWTADYWMSNAWEGRVYDIDWLIDRFSPVPTWPENWKELHAEWMRSRTSLTNLA